MLGGLDWTGTALGQAFGSQEQVLFLFAGIIFIISVILHMLSIPERPFSPPNLLKVTGTGESTSQLSFRPVGHAPLLDVIAEEDASAQATSQENNESDPEESEMDFLTVERVRSKSDSVLAMAVSTIELDADLHPDAQLFLPEMHHFISERQGEPEYAFKSSANRIWSSSPPGGSSAQTDVMTLEPKYPEQKDPTKCPCSLLQSSSGHEGLHHRQVKTAATVTRDVCVGLKYLH